MQAYQTRDGTTQYKPAADDVMAAAAGDESTGWCLACGAEQSGCEPDMRRGTCDSCQAAKVYGAEELILMGLVHG